MRCKNYKMLKKNNKLVNIWENMNINKEIYINH